MNEFLKELFTSNILSIFALVGILEAVKKVGIPVKYIELLSIVLGAVVNVLLTGPSIEAVLTGVVVGLASCKLYDKILDVFNLETKDRE